MRSIYRDLRTRNTLPITGDQVGESCPALVPGTSPVEIRRLRLVRDTHELFAGKTERSKVWENGHSKEGGASLQHGGRKERLHRGMGITDRGKGRR